MKRVCDWFIPIYTVSEANSSDHWSKKKKRHDLQRRWIWLYFKDKKPELSLPCHVKLTRVGKRKLDSDNLPVSMKYIRDAIADQIVPGKAAGQADSDERLSWEYEQKVSKGETGVQIEFFMQ